ncbi:variable large family protein [Borrelia sp. HM]|uniref:variable large family protein n=1 Tax=Borrelia sp. HM TaxID=1882662 RepID=UPI0021060A8B|nr:variable large family protein [Borrelia sp. HM]
MVIGLLMGCNNGAIAELEKKSTFYESVMKIGHGFQEIFGIFGKAMGDDFGIVKSDDNRSVVGDHFEKVKKGLEGTKNKLEELSGKISETKNADGSTIENVKNAIKGASDVFDKLISALIKLAGAVGNAPIGDAGSQAAAPAEVASVKDFIEGVKAIVEIAPNSDVKINGGDAGATVDNANGPKALTNDVKASGNATKLADEVTKADPWAMIDKIKNATIVKAPDAPAAKDDAGKLATGSVGSSNSAGTAATNADLAAAVALKAMTKGGKFTQPNDANEVAIMNAKAASAVNKVLGVLDEIIRRTVSNNLEKVRKAVEKINYSETNGEVTEAKK